MLIFHSFKASGSTFSRLHQRLLKSFKEAAISLRHLEKSILEGNLYLGPQDKSKIENSFTFWEVRQTLKVAQISLFCPIEGEFQSELHKTFDVCLCKIH